MVHKTIVMLVLLFAQSLLLGAVWVKNPAEAILVQRIAISLIAFSMLYILRAWK